MTPRLPSLRARAPARAGPPPPGPARPGRPRSPARPLSSRSGRASRVFVGLLTGAALAFGAATRAGAQAVTSQYDDTFRKYSKRFFGPAFDWRLFKAQAMAESQLDPAAASRAGARGLMQLMPTTFREIQSRNPEFHTIDDPVWNIAAGICYDRQLWTQWEERLLEGERVRFVLGSYNAGRGTLLRARSVAERRRLDPFVWTNIRTIAPQVPNWRHQETFVYVDRIESNLTWLCDQRRTAGPGDR